MILTRNDGRACDQVRPLKITYDLFGYADASVLLELGQTKVLSMVTMQHGVPSFLKGRGAGWLTAEYSMLPCATRVRNTRESSQVQRNARSVEISRLIGRSFRSVVDLDLIGERTIWIDCDVLQADGGTRVAALSAASLALELAEKRWLDSGVIRKKIMKESLAAISVGIVNEHVYLDLAQNEDNGAEADFNFVLTKSGDLIEVQGTSEKAPMSWENFEYLKKFALQGIKNIFEMRALFEVPEKLPSHNDEIAKNRYNISRQYKQPIFSLGNRQKT